MQRSMEYISARCAVCLCSASGQCTMVAQSVTEPRYELRSPEDELRSPEDELRSPEDGLRSPQIDVCLIGVKMP